MRLDGTDNLVNPVTILRLHLLPTALLLPLRWTARRE
jgi:hypothetical protein